MTKPNRLISILLSVIMLVSLFPQAIFAADNPVAKIGSTEYETLEDAFEAAFGEAVTIKLLNNAVLQAGVDIYTALTIDMQGHSISAVNDDILIDIATSPGDKVVFKNGVLNVNLSVTDADTTITAPDGEDFAVNGTVYVDDESASLKISGARVGINGTFKTSSPDIDISGTIRAVDLAEEITLLGGNSSNKIVGAAEIGGTLSDVQYTPDEYGYGTYMVGDTPAKQIKIEEAGDEPAKPSPTVSPEGVKIYTGQEGTFNITFDSDEKLEAYVQKNGLDDITATLSEDQKTVTVSVSKDYVPKDPDKIDIGETFTLYVHVVGDALRQAKTEFTVVKCSHPKDKIEDDESDATTCRCTICGINMVKLSATDLSDWSWTNQYFETIDEAINAIPAFDDIARLDDGSPRYQYEVRIYEDIVLDHNLEVKDKTFYFASGDTSLHASNYKYQLSFTNGYSMIISRDTIDPKNNVCLYQFNNSIGNITLGKNGYLKSHPGPTIDKLTLADESADISGLKDPNYGEPMVKIKKLSVTAPDCTLADFLEYDDITLGYRGYSYIDSRNEYAFDYFYNETYQKYIDNVVIAEAPIQKFTVKLDEASKNAVYPDDVIINASVKSGNATYTVDLPRNLTCDWTESKQSSKNSKLTLSKVPAGTYDNIIVYAVGNDGYRIGKYVSVTVGKKSIENNNDITIKIKGKDAPYELTYAPGIQVKESDVQVFDNGVDVTSFFDITVPKTVLFPNTAYNVTVTAKADGSYSGERTVNFTLVKATPAAGRDFVVTLPSSLVYDGTPKSVTFGSAVGLKASEIGYAKKLPDGSFDLPTAEAPTEPGTYKVYVIINSTPTYNAYNDCAAEFTIEKADVKYEYSIPFEETYGYEEDKKIAGRVLHANSIAANAKAPTGQITVKYVASGISSEHNESVDLKDDGSFEFDLPNTLTANTAHNFTVYYSGNVNYEDKSDACHTVIITKSQLNSLNVSDTEHRYSPGVERKITVSTPDSKKLTNDDFDVKYYLVDENSGKLASAEPVRKTVSASRYLYVVSLNSESAKCYYLANEYTVNSTDIPDMNTYTNIGFMDIKASSDFSQKPISFAKGIVNVKSGEKFTNTLANENASTVTFHSSDTDVAEIDQNGEITAKKSGTATITATSTMEGTTPVYASCTVNVKKELAKDSFELKAETKSYDGSKYATVTATLKDEFKVDPTDVVKAEITAKFDQPNAGGRTVSYEITDISGKNADKYVLSDNADDLKGTLDGTIEKAVVTVICAKVTTRTFDGTAQTVDVSAMANGRIFDPSNYTVKYNGENTAVNVGEYTISIELTESADANYTVEPFNAVLKITNASQDIFAVENVPENVYYGDTFEISATGANGGVEYEIVNGAEFAEIIKDNGIAKVKVNGVGKVTIKATSKKDGYTDRTAIKTFEAKKRILTPTAAATNRKYNGENGVEVEISLANFANGDTVTASASGSMINSDAGNGKIVYVSGITLSDSEKYTLGTNSLQTTVDISPIEIESFTISASDKKYDGTANAQANVDKISNVIESDKGFVSIAGTAEFDGADAGENKTVTFTASGLSGAKAQNYTLGETSATASAAIEPLKVNFTVGQTTFVYDGKDKEINVSATDENGRIFKDFSVSYDAAPNEAGTYTATISIDSTNYITDHGSITVTVENATQSQLVIAGLPGTVEYGDRFKLEAFGGADNGTVSWEVTDGKASITNDGEVFVEGTGKIEITAVKTSDNYSDISSKVIFTAMPKNITFDFDCLEQTFGSTLGKVKVIPSDDRIAESNFEVTYDGSEEFPANAGKYKVEVKTLSPNYKGSARATLVIAKAQATGKIQINNKFTYGDAVSASVTDIPDNTSAKITYAGTRIYIPQEEAPKNAGNYTAIAEITGENYETLTVTKNFTIEKANLTVKAQNASRAYGDANPVFKLIYDGFINGEDESVLLYEPTATVNANASSAVGEYNITISGGYAENYKFAYDNTGVLEITGATDAKLYITGTSSAYVNDSFNLSAFYGNTKINATWKSSNTDVAEVDENGTVTAKSAGTATITATAGENYGNAEATFDITVKQSNITLVPTDTVKIYNGERQEISFEPVSGFTPVVGENVTVKYVLTADPTVTEPIKAGTYSVTYTVTDKSFVGGGTATMYITKANITVIPKNITKVYGDKPIFRLVPSMQTSLVSDDILLSLAENARFSCGGTAENAKVGQYDIVVVLGTYENENLTFTVDGTGTLDVTKAPLTVRVKDVSFEYGAEMPLLEPEFTGFKNNETKDVLGGIPEFSYNGITNVSDAKTYTEQTSVSGFTSDNYEIEYQKGNVTVTPISVTASAGTAKKSYLTILLDKAVKGLTKENFTVKAGEITTELTDVKESADGKTYTLNGSFAAGVEYTVEISYANNNYSIIGNTVKLTPSGSSGGNGGGGGSSSVSSYTVSFNTNGADKIASRTVKKNETAKEPAEPKKDGFVFDGWYSDKNLTVKYDFAEKVTKNITLYAKWTESTNDNSEKQIILTIGNKDALVFGTEKSNDVAPKIVNNRTMLPARFAAENLGALVLWDEEKELVTIKGKNLETNEDVEILITIGAENAVVNGKEVKLDSPAFVENDRTYTPIRFISEELGAKVEWIESEQKVVITVK
ncbi:stalk domain-containing protein [Qingrenia yutianensis]|uniref:InlB B-repeat-containing protein n=1 Tax=Qingrenia yutianensis TaxID=2763676 RepID=A0A926ITB9_9FIRM|nr:stalk domain-containing protein [Qingrenia yutianensis]MBC8596415.1 InlB B-repeat-containing protein [Qingrenia yutianensis]